MRLLGQKTVADVLKKVGPEVENRLKPYFQKTKSDFPPKEITLLVFKDEKILELWIKGNDKWDYIRSYPVLAASGKAGPKLKEGDLQVPEGIYNIIGLNPNGYFYLTMLLDYPNLFDKKNASVENRTNLGGDICIHGKAASIGCIAIGDVAVEEVFVLVARTGLKNTKVIIAPNDLRVKPPIDAGQLKVPWVQELYDSIKEELNRYPKV
ncbi:MAG: L,D-transpeptidase family protein [bacterium]